jgi:hypothetical protein
MSSEESTSNSASPPVVGEPKPRSHAGLVAGSLLAMAVLVWAMAPRRAKFVPAPLHPPPAGCPLTTPVFTPSDATDIPTADLRSLTPAQRNHVIYRMNMEPCSCGCNTSVVACRVSHPQCPMGNQLVEKIVAEEKATATAQAAAANPN